MTTLNPFDLLVDSDGDVPWQLIESFEKAAAAAVDAQNASSQSNQQKAAKLPSIPLPPAQAVREARNDSGRGRGRGLGRGEGRGRVGYNRGGYNRDYSNNSGAPQGDGEGGRAFETERRPYGGSRPPYRGDHRGGYRNDSGRGGGRGLGRGEGRGRGGYNRGGYNRDYSNNSGAPQGDGEGGRAFETERRPYGGSRPPYRGDHRGGYSNEEGRHGDRPRRTYERHSGTGHGVTEEVPEEAEKIATAENVPTVEEQEMTLEEYEKVLEEKRSALLALKTAERKVELDKDLQSMQQLSSKRDEESVFIKLASDKDKRKEVSEKEKAKKGLIIEDQTAWIMTEVEALQNFISEVEEKELEDMKYRINNEESDPSPFDNPYRLVDRYDYDGKVFTPSYFQVKRSPQDYMFLKKIDKSDIHRFKQSIPRRSNFVKDEVSWMLANDPDFNIWESVKEMAERVGDPTLYQNTIKALATLIFSLYNFETLFRRNNACSHHTQLNKLWKKIYHLNKNHSGCLPTFCYAIANHRIDDKEYPFVTQADLDRFIYHYVDELIYREPRPESPYADYPPPQRKKKDAMFNEMHEVVSKMESPKITKGYLDDYTRLLINLANENSLDKEQELVDRVMTIINTSCEEWKSKMKFYVLSRIKLKECWINNMRSGVGQPLYYLVYDSHTCKDHDPRVLVCADVREVIEVAEFRREALGSRFIKRNHLIWAFYELGFGLPPDITRMFSLNNEDEDRPPYHIYLASMKLAKSLGEEIVQLQHFIFAVLSLTDIADDEKLATEMKEAFRAFLRDAASDSVRRPNENAHSWLKNVPQVTHP